MNKDHLLPIAVVVLVFASVGVVLIPGVVRDLEIPHSVRSSMEERYPEARDLRWEVDGNGFFEARFRSNDGKFRADFRKSGEWIETEQSVDEDELPKPVLDAIEERYRHFGKINEIERVQHHRKGLFYDIEFARKGQNLDIELQADGLEVGSLK